MGEAFRFFIGTKWVNVSYGVATLYVLADTIDKTRASLRVIIESMLKNYCFCNTHFFQSNKENPEKIKNATFVAADTLIWQMLASVIIPGFTINRVCYFSNLLLLNNKLISKNRKLLVTGIGLAVIPLIIKPIDKCVDNLLDASFRKLI